MLTINHADGKLLREFVGRFMAEKIKVLDCSDDVAKITFMSAINNPDLIQTNALQPARTYSEEIQCAVNICKMKMYLMPKNSNIKWSHGDILKLRAKSCNKKELLEPRLGAKEVELRPAAVTGADRPSL